MKHATAAAVVLAIVYFICLPSAFAHDRDHPDAPSPSPDATVSQVVGYGKVAIEFGRPGVKGRQGELWGKVVPYDGGNPRPWMGGANGNAVITFEEDVKVNGQALPAGTYGLMMIPAEDTWTIIFSTNGGRRGILEYTPEKDALRTEAAPEKAEFREWLTYEITKTGDVTARIELHWENLKVGFDIETPDHRTMDEATEQISRRRGRASDTGSVQ